MGNIDRGEIALPDIQRPFVWQNSRVRDLIDSMYRGFPVGYLLFWEGGTADGVRHILLEPKQKREPRYLIIDGQQRLISLFAVFRGQEVLDSKYNKRKIAISFRPGDGRFEVADASIHGNPEWIENISGLLNSSESSRKLVNKFIDKLSDHKGQLSEDDKEDIGHNLDQLFDLKKYLFTALEIGPDSDEQEVADIFVRINSKGVNLKQADFILTLLSVFWDEGRKELEDFCSKSRIPQARGQEPSPFNHFISPKPDQLLRVSIAYGFGRAQINSVYQILRGKDPKTGILDEKFRDQQFDRLKKAQAETLNLTHWHQYLNSLVGAGFRSQAMISSETAIVYSYVFYLIGKVRFRLPYDVLQKAIGRWFFVASLTGRYTSSSETAMDRDLVVIRGIRSGDDFIEKLDEIISDKLTGDFWMTTLPSQLSTSAARSPILFAYMAAQCKLHAPVLFSPGKYISELVDPAVKPKKKALEKHHLFPKAWLEKNGVSGRSEINQIANYALIEWPKNISIGSKGPQDYVPELREGIPEAEWLRMNEMHALPDGWEHMEYPVFLKERRKLMANIIRRGFAKLG